MFSLLCYLAPLKIFVVPNSTTLYVTSGNLLYKSLNDGLTWQIIYRLPLNDIGINPISLHENYLDEMMIGMLRLKTNATTNLMPSVQQSFNGGYTWKAIDDGLDHADLISLTRIKNKLYAGTLNQGIFVKDLET